jgi:hypothetical protein
MSLFNVQIFMTSPPPKQITEFVLRESAARQTAQIVMRYSLHWWCRDGKASKLMNMAILQRKLRDVAWNRICPKKVVLILVSHEHFAVSNTFRERGNPWILNWTLKLMKAIKCHSSIEEFAPCSTQSLSCFHKRNRQTCNISDFVVSVVLPQWAHCISTG